MWGVQDKAGSSIWDLPVLPWDPARTATALEGVNHGLHQGLFKAIVSGSGRVDQLIGT